MDSKRQKLSGKSKKAISPTQNKPTPISQNSHASSSKFILKRKRSPSPPDLPDFDFPSPVHVPDFPNHGVDPKNLHFVDDVFVRQLQHVDSESVDFQNKIRLLFHKFFNINL